MESNLDEERRNLVSFEKDIIGFLNKLTTIFKKHVTTQQTPCSSRPEEYNIAAFFSGIGELSWDLNRPTSS